MKKHPEYDVTVLLRSVPNTFSERYPKVKIVKGDFDSFDIISKAASEADVVVRMSESIIACHFEEITDREPR